MWRSGRTATSSPAAGFGRIGGVPRSRLAEITPAGRTTRMGAERRPGHRVLLSPALQSGRLHDRLLARRAQCLPRRPLRPCERRRPQRGRGRPARRTARRCSVQPEHLRAGQLRGVHDARDEPRLPHDRDELARLHLRRLLEGERLAAVVQRLGVRSRHRGARPVVHGPGRRRHAGVCAAGRDPLRRRALQHRRPGLPAQPARHVRRPATTSPRSTRSTNALRPWNPGANSNHGLLVIEAATQRVAFGGFMTRMGGIDQQGLAVYKAPHLP